MADRVRVLIIISGLAIGEPLGGAERFGIELARNLDLAQVEPIVCAFWRRGTPSEEHWLNYLTEAGIEVFFAADWESSLELSKYARGFENIAAYLRNRPVDVIHSHFQVGSIAAWLLRRTLGAKALIRTAHAGKEWGDTFLGFLCRQVFIKWIFPFVFDIEVGVSRAKVSSLDRRPGARIGGKKALLFYNGISLDRFSRVGTRQDKRLEMGLLLDDPVVGSVGRLRKEKGYSIFLDSAVIVKAQIPNVKFIIIGDGEQRASLERQAERLRLTETVILAGSRSDVESLYGIMDLFVLASLWESLPTVILESMASGVPVVATDISGTRELIQAGRTGWLVQPGDPAYLAASIIEALSNPAKRAEVAQRARQEVVPRFSMEYIAGQYMGVYRQVCCDEEMHHERQGEG